GEGPAPDLTPPVLTILAPAPWSLVAGPNVVVRVSADEPVEGTVNGTPLVADGDLRWRAELLVGDGVQRLAIIVRDAAGNETAREIEIDVDGTPPVLALDSPADGLVVTTDRILVAGQVVEANLRTLTARLGSTTHALAPAADGRFERWLP